MSEPWPERPLAELCEFRNGLWKGKKPPYIHVGVIRNTNFTADGSLDDSDIAFLDVEEKQFAKRQLQFGDLILEKSGGGPKQPVGRVITFEKNDGLYSFSNFTSIIRVIDPSILYFRYLHRVLFWYYISGATEGMQRRSTGIRNLAFPTYKQLSIPLPSLPEQKRIVAILDEAFAAIATATANAEKNLANARELFQSELSRVFTQKGDGWVDKKLNDVCDLQNGVAFKSKDYIASSNTLNIRMSNIRPNGLFDAEHNIRFLPDSYAADYQRYQLREGDLVIAMTDMAGDPKILGVPTLVTGLRGRTFLLNQRVGRLCGFSKGLHVPFLRYFLASPPMKSYYKSKGAGGLQINISKKDILSAHISLPSSAIQKRVVSELDSLSEETLTLQSIYQQKQEALSELKQSILHKAFTGEFTTDSKAPDRMLSEAGL